MNLSPTPIIELTNRVTRTTLRSSERLARAMGSEAYGLYRRARHLRQAPKPDMDDVTLARKVETELFRPAGSPKGSVNINVVEGVVYLRGEVKRPAQIKSLETRARAIPEVRGVENLLHLPKTPSPTRADSPRRVQKSPSSPKAPPRRRTSATRVRTTAEAPVGATVGRAGNAGAAEERRPASPPSPAVPNDPTATDPTVPGRTSEPAGTAGPAPGGEAGIPPLEES